MNLLAKLSNKLSVGAALLLSMAMTSPAFAVTGLGTTVATSIGDASPEVVAVIAAVAAVLVIIVAWKLIKRAFG